MFNRLKRWWTLSDDEKTLHSLKKDRETFTKKKKKRLAVIVEDDPLDVFPTQEELEHEHNSDK